MADTTLSVLTCTPPLDIPISLDGRILNVLTTELGNADTSYTYFKLAADGYNIFTLQFNIVATTLTIEASNSPLSVTDASAVWTDLTSVLTSGSATITATGTMTIQLPFLWSRIRIKRVTTNATNSLSLNLTRGRVQ